MILFEPGGRKNRDQLTVYKMLAYIKIFFDNISKPEKIQYAEIDQAINEGKIKSKYNFSLVLNGSHEIKETEKLQEIRSLSGDFLNLLQAVLLMANDFQKKRKQLVFRDIKDLRELIGELTKLEDEEEKNKESEMAQVFMGKVYDGFYLKDGKLNYEWDLRNKLPTLRDMPDWKFE